MLLTRRLPTFSSKLVDGWPITRARPLDCPCCWPVPWDLACLSWRRNRGAKSFLSHKIRRPKTRRKLSRLEQIYVEAADGEENVLTKDRLIEAMQMHLDIETGTSTTNGESYNLIDLCTTGGNTCASSSSDICQCRITSILRQWDYSLDNLENDQDILSTITQFGSQDDLNSIISQAVYDENDQIISGKAFSISYFLDDRSFVENGEEKDPVNEAWEKDVFLETVESYETAYPALFLNWFSGRSQQDDGSSAIQGDLQLVQFSYIAVFIFMGATLGNFKCGLGSRWTMAFAAVALVGLSTVAGIGLSSFFGLVYSPVHSLLPFVLLGIGVDDAFVIANAFDQERQGKPRSTETNEELLLRSSRALSRAGASITVTSLTDLVAFGISSSSVLPALASFSAYASISVFFLWAFAAVFFTACMVIDERRQIENRRECVCCMTRKRSAQEIEETMGANNGSLFMMYFRDYHGKAILSWPGKVLVLIVFAGLMAFGAYSATLLNVEDTQRDFIPQGTSLSDFFEASDELFPDQGINFFFVFEGETAIFQGREELAQLDQRVVGMSQAPPYIAEPVSEEVFRNVMAGLKEYLRTSGTAAIGGAALGDDGWPTNESDFVQTLWEYTRQGLPGGRFSRDVAFSEKDGDTLVLDAMSVETEYVRLTKESRGDTIDDAEKQIDAMDSTRAMVVSWNEDEDDSLPPAFVYSDDYLTIEGFKVISREFYRNVALAVAAVAVIVLITVANPLAAFLITFAVVGCIIEILGFMYHLGVVIDSVSAVMLVLAVGLSVDYSAHIGHCFMTKTGDNRNERVLETLTDVGTAVMNGAITTFLAVAILLWSESYVFWVLSRMFMLTVVFGASNGLILLPVLLSLVGPKAFEHHSSSASNMELETSHDHEQGNSEEGVEVLEDEKPSEVLEDEKPSLSSD